MSSVLEYCRIKKSGVIMKMSLLLALLTTSLQSFADTGTINQAIIMSKTYVCSNGGAIQLFETRYGNVKKVVFSKAGSVNQIGYVAFWRMTDFYEGNVFTSMTFPDPQTGELPVRGNSFADMAIEHDGRGLILNLTPVRGENDQLRFSCRNY
jgi:hypothetical protein